MRDEAEKWGQLPDWNNALLEAVDIRGRTVAGLVQHLVSGDLDAACAAAVLPDSGVGALSKAVGATYAVRMARDRVLLVGKSTDNIPEGWDERGFAVTRLSAALQVFELEGLGVDDVVKRATSLNLTAPGPSAAVSFAGAMSAIYRYEAPERLRLHVDRGLAGYVWSWLNASIAMNR